MVPRESKLASQQVKASFPFKTHNPNQKIFLAGYIDGNKPPGIDFFHPIDCVDPTMTSSAEITQWLDLWSQGNAGAESELMRLVLPEMHKLARRYMYGERATHTLQPTALVNEAYLKLIDSRTARWTDRAHFFAFAAVVMKNILVDHARHRLRDKRDGVDMAVELNDDLPNVVETPEQVVALGDALDALAKFDARKAKVVELRFFGGLSVKETAEVLKVHPNTVISDWGLARAWLLREIAPDSGTQ